MAADFPERITYHHQRQRTLQFWFWKTVSIPTSRKYWTRAIAESRSQLTTMGRSSFRPPSSNCDGWACNAAPQVTEAADSYPKTSQNARPRFENVPTREVRVACTVTPAVGIPRSHGLCSVRVFMGVAHDSAHQEARTPSSCMASFEFPANRANRRIGRVRVNFPTAFPALEPPSPRVLVAAVALR
jgi:hypothetical protein